MLRKSQTARQRVSYSFFKTLMLTLGIVVLLFGMYEIVERLWLLDLSMERLHMLHIVRGLAAAFIAATLVGWFLLRESQPLLATALSPEEWSKDLSTESTQRIATYARWFIQMRWIAIVVALMLIFVTVQVGHLLTHEVWWPLVSTVACLVLLNVIYLALVRKGYANVRLLVFQAYADLFMLTVLLHFSGSIENPLAPLMLFHVVIAGIILSRRQCFALAFIAALMFSTLAVLELWGTIDHYTLAIFPHEAHNGETIHAAREPLYVASQVVLQSTILLLTAFFVTTLADRLRHDEAQLRLDAERISMERQLLTQALDTTGTGLCVCDAEMVPLWHNQQWNNWFGRGTTNSSFYDEIYGETSPARETLSDGRVRVWEMVLREEDTEQTLLTTTAPLTNQSGEINRVVQLAQDITEQKVTQAGLLRAGKLAAVGELAGEVAHEVNNPVAIISAKARLLLANHRDGLSDKAAEELIKITEMSDRIARITQGLLSYSRPSAGTRTVLDVRQPIRRALSLVEHRATTNNVEIVNRLPHEDLPMLANADELEQAFLNVFLNAIDAMPDGGTMTVSAVSRDGHHTIDVLDTGHGIDEDTLERVMEPFFTTKPDGAGTGLGLSICAGLVRSHGGTIEINAAPGKGTRVVIDLPNRVEAKVQDHA